MLLWIYNLVLSLNSYMKMTENVGDSVWSIYGISLPVHFLVEQNFPLLR